MSLGVGGLPYFGMVIGMLFAGVYIVLTQPSYNRMLDANGGVPIPEWRLPPVIVGGVAFSKYPSVLGCLISSTPYPYP